MLIDFELLRFCIQTFFYMIHELQFSCQCKRHFKQIINLYVFIKGPAHTYSNGTRIKWIS